MIAAAITAANTSGARRAPTANGMGEFSNVLLAVMARACYVAKICVDPAAPMT